MAKRRMLAMISALIMSVSLLACSSEKFNSDEDVSSDSYSENPSNSDEDVALRNIKLIPIPTKTRYSDGGVKLGNINLHAEPRISSSDIYKSIFDSEDSSESDEEEKEEKSETGIFIMLEKGKIGSDLYQYIMYDPDTMVMYTYISKGYDDGVVFNVMYNADGTLKLYSPDTEAE